MSETESTAESKHVIEQSVRLSDSFLWSRQRRFYEGEGVSAWSTGMIPNHITTNPLIARAYARLLVAWLRDLYSGARSPGRADESLLDPDQPVYVIEIGSGPGRFGFYFLRQLSQLLRRVDSPPVRVTYVMTDVAETNLAFVRKHPSLQPYVEAGMLDFATFDAENPGELELLHSGAVLRPGSVRNPLVCVANYVFDTIRQDLFSIDRGEFREMRVTVSTPHADVNLEDPAVLDNLTISFEPRSVDATYYEDPEFDELLREYQQELPNVGFLFPRAAIECIRYLSRISGGAMLLLSADKGFDRVDALIGQGGPGLAVHGGCFSLMVNYDAIGRYVVRAGGQILRAPHRNTHLDTVCCALGLPEAQTPRLRETFDESVAEFGPEQAFTIAAIMRGVLKDVEIEEFLAWVRFTNWDPIMFMQMALGLTTKAGAATLNQKADLADVIRRVWEEYYYIGEQPDGAVILGVLLRTMHHQREALSYFQRSLELSGARAQTYYEMGVCFFELQDPDRARQCADRALEIDPACAEARSLRLRIEADESRSFSGPPIPTPESESQAVPVEEPIA